MPSLAVRGAELDSSMHVISSSLSVAFMVESSVITDGIAAKVAEEDLSS